MERGRGRTEGGAERGEQLGGLLAKLVGDHGQSGAAAELGVSERTIRRSVAAGKLTRGLRIALEKHLLMREGAGMPGSTSERRLDALERWQTEQTQQLISVAGELQSARGAISELARDVAGRLGEMQETLSEVLSVQQEIRRRLDQVEKRSQVRADPPPVREAAVEPVGSGAGAAPSRDGDGYDEEVEGLVSEWRRLKAQEAEAGTRLDRVTAAEARLELEIELIREHEMGIPPGERWGLGVRLREVSWRWGALADRRRQRRRLTVLWWVRRILTLGRWRR